MKRQQTPHILPIGPRQSALPTYHHTPTFSHATSFDLKYDIAPVMPPREELLSVPPRARTRTTPSVFSEASFASSSSSSSGSSSATSPTTLSTPPSSVPPSPSPSQLSFGKPRPLPFPPSSSPRPAQCLPLPPPARPQPPPSSTPLPSTPSHPHNSRHPPPYSPRSVTAPQLTVLTTPPPSQRTPSPSPLIPTDSSTSTTTVTPFPRPRFLPHPAAPTHLTHSRTLSASVSGVRPLPRRPPPPGPPSEGNTPITLFGRPRWGLDSGEVDVAEHDADGGEDGELDWAWIDEVLERAG